MVQFALFSANTDNVATRLGYHAFFIPAIDGAAGLAATQSRPHSPRLSFLRVRSPGSLAAAALTNTTAAAEDRKAG
jgi:hypothetical protein